MSRVGAVILIVAFVVLAVGMAIKGFWAIDYPWVTWLPLIAFLSLVLLSVIIDFKFFAEIFSLKTTRHGMNMGTLILLVLISLGAINYLAVSRNKKWDLTDEKLNSLSPQSIQLLKSLKGELVIRGFFNDSSREMVEKKGLFQFLSKQMEYENSKIKVEVWDDQKRPDLIKQYNVEFSGTVVLSYNGKQSSITDVTEQELINAILKLSREKNKVVYFLTGHGEIDLESKEAAGGFSFKKALEDASYEIKTLNLIQQPKFPEDIDVLAIMSPKRELFDSEKTAILGYIKKGGRVFIAADPGQKNNLAQILKPLGLDYGGNFIIDQMGSVLFRSAYLTVGTGFSKTSDITKQFQGGATAFQLATPIEKLGQVPEGFTYEELVKSSPASFTKNQLSETPKFDEKADKKGPHTVVIKVSGKFAEEKDAKDFSVIVFGDGDIFTNQLLNIQVVPFNRDLVLNSVSFLAKDDQLISIRPKAPKGTTLMMSENQFDLLKYMLFIPLPFLFAAASGFLWFKRRHA